MCFSATASFATSTVLIPTGLYGLWQGKPRHDRYRGFYAFPLLFGVQQALEGMVWLQLEQQGPATASLPALGFLFFVFVVWPVLVPLSSWQAEQQPGLRRLFAAMAWLGALFAVALFVPLLMNDGLFDASSVAHSIYYRVDTPFSGHVPDSALTAVYSALVILPLLLSSTPAMRAFGISVLVSFVITLLVYRYAFVSVWCFFAALLSLQVLWTIRRHAAAPAALRDSLADH